MRSLNRQVAVVVDQVAVALADQVVKDVGLAVKDVGLAVDRAVCEYSRLLWRRWMPITTGRFPQTKSRMQLLP